MRASRFAGAFICATSRKLQMISARAWATSRTPRARVSVEVRLTGALLPPGIGRCWGALEGYAGLAGSDLVVSLAEAEDFGFLRGTVGWVWA